MHRLIAILLAATLIVPSLVAAPAPAPAAAEPEGEGESLVKSLPRTKGRSQVSLDKYAKLKIPQGFMFTDGEGKRKLLEAMGNPTGGNELGFLSPTNLDWFVVFRFSDVGYVKDDDKDKLDPKELLSVIKRGTEEGNKMRQKMGSAPMKIIGWGVPPKYNDQTKK